MLQTYNLFSINVQVSGDRNTTMQPKLGNFTSDKRKTQLLLKSYTTKSNPIQKYHNKNVATTNMHGDNVHQHNNDKENDKKETKHVSNFQYISCTYSTMHHNCGLLYNRVSSQTAKICRVTVTEFEYPYNWPQTECIVGYVQKLDTTNHILRKYKKMKKNSLQLILAHTPHSVIFKLFFKVIYFQCKHCGGFRINISFTWRLDGHNSIWMI